VSMQDRDYDGQNVPEVRFRKFLAGRPREYRETDPAKLQDQINGLSDILLHVVRERDQLQTDFREAKKIIDADRWVNVKLWALSGVVTAELAAIGWLATALFARLR
jgi:hypothetical protein